MFQLPNSFATNLVGAERLWAVHYVNFYFSNEAVILPAFGGENEESDRRAAALLAQWNPGRKIIPVQARAILVGGGNIHCITQQIPAAKMQQQNAAVKMQQR